jgi:hypothetical protein
LHAVLVGAIAAIDKTPSSAALRGTLYAFLVNFFGFSRNASSALRQPGDVELAVSTRTAERESGDRLLARLAPDCCSGPDAWRAVAFACLDGLLAAPSRDRGESHDDEDLSTSLVLVQTLSRKGHLNLFCSSGRFEEPLRACVRDPSAPLNILFVWESQLSLLIRVAQSAQGIVELHTRHFRTWSVD